MARSLRRHGAAVALQGEGILLLARDLEAIDQILRGEPHGQVRDRVVGIAPAVLDGHRSHAKALPAVALDQVGDGAHGLHAAGQHDIRRTCPDQVMGILPERHQPFLVSLPQYPDMTAR